jgi:acetyltransferase
VGSALAHPARDLLKERRVATYNNPGAAAQAFVRSARYVQNQELLMETPASIPEDFTPDTISARAMVDNALAAGHTRLNVIETQCLLDAYRIPLTASRFAATPEEAARISADLDTSVAIKVLSADIRQKSDVGGVAFNLSHPDEVLSAAHRILLQVQQLRPGARIEGFEVQPMLSRAGAYEITIGVRTGRRFGPVIFFGQGGTETKVINDIAYALPPLNMQLARDLMSRTRIYGMLTRSPARYADVETLALTLIKVSQMVTDLGEIQSLDINPLWASPEGVVALDASVDIQPYEGIPTERFAIRPYPKDLEEEIVLPDGQSLRIRPILPEDEPPLRDMVRRMPEKDLRLRFFQPIRELSHAMAARLTQLDYDREMAFVITDEGIPGQTPIWGVVRFNADPDLERAEYAITLDRAVTGKGLGPLLMRRIIDYARRRGIQEIYGEVLRENEPMLKLNRALGFQIRHDPEDPGIMLVSLKL